MSSKKVVYTKAQVKAAAKPMPLYGRRCVNWAGRTCADEKNDDAGNELYTEIIAGAVLDNEKLYLNIPPYSVRDSFAFLDHDGKTKRDISNRIEDRFCLMRYARRDDEAGVIPFGRVINYQLNIVPSQKVNVDLVAYDGVTRTLWLIEVKGNKNKTSDETLLRCALEIRTYYSLLENKLGKLVSTVCSAHGESIPPEDIEKGVTVKCAVWVPKKSRPALEYADLENRPNLKELMTRWGICFETFDPEKLWL